MLESNAKCPYPKKLRQVFLCLRPPSIDFCLGRSINFVGSESGQKQSVKLLQNMVSNTTQHHPTPSQPHTVCVTVAYFLCCTTTERQGRDGSITKKNCNGSRKRVRLNNNSSVPPPPLVPGGKHTPLRERGWGEPILVIV